MLEPKKVALAVALFSALAACKPKPGAPCKTSGDRACADEKTVLVCQDGKWASFACGGARGCAKEGDGVYCDVGKGNEGDPCPKEDEKRKMCSSDGKARLTCTGGTYVATKCVGIGCYVKDGKIECDPGEPQLGTPCDPEQDRNSCGLDRKSHIHCAADHRWTVERICRGPSGCQRLAVNEAQTCDVTAAEVGDPCRLDEQSRTTCSVDRKAKLACVGGKWQVESKCDKPCTSDDGTIACDVMHGCVMLPKQPTCGP